MDYKKLAVLGRIMRWLGLAIILAYLIDRFTSVSLPVVDNYKFSAIVIWLLGTILLRWTQYQQRKIE